MFPPETVDVAVPSDLIERLLTQGASLQIQIGAVHSLPSYRPDSAKSRPVSGPNSAKPMSILSNRSSFEDIPIRLDTEEEKVTEIDEDEDYEPPEPSYEPASPRSEQREERPIGYNTNAPNVFADNVNSNASGRGREVQREVQ